MTLGPRCDLPKTQGIVVTRLTLHRVLPSLGAWTVALRAKLWPPVLKSAGHHESICSSQPLPGPPNQNWRWGGAGIWRWGGAGITSPLKFGIHPPNGNTANGPQAFPYHSPRSVRWPEMAFCLHGALPAGPFHPCHLPSTLHLVPHELRSNQVTCTQ